MTGDRKNRAVFFDRDGIIFAPVKKESSGTQSKETGATRAPRSVAEFKAAGGVVPDAKETLRALQAKGFLAILVTNQPDVGYGHLSREEWERIQAHAAALPFDDIYVCFHRRDEGCDCKKPKPGMLFDAARKWNIDLAASYFIGDTESDTGAAKAAGCRSILIDAWYNRHLQSDFRVPTLHGIGTIVQ